MNEALAPEARAEASPQPGARVIYFAGDATNPTVNLRINAFQAARCAVSAYTFRRKKFNTRFQPNWPNTHLGVTVDKNYLLRIPALLLACLSILGRRGDFRNADFFYSRLFDVALLALFAKWASGSKAKFVYEIEDIQGVFFKRNLAGAVFRWLERRVLARADLLVVLSPGFLRGYYEPVQRYTGPSFVLENKLQLRKPAPPFTPAARRWRDTRTKWVIGWNGTLRCARSMEILSELAERLGDRVEIRTRGHPTETGLDQYLAIVNRHANWTYGGEYTIPDDLEEIYGRVHFSWCFDFHDAAGNSPLLLACRMYQGGYYGAVPLVAQGSEMERFLAPHRIGHAFAEPIVDGVCAFLANLTWDDYERERERVLSLGRTLFLDTGEDTARLLRAIYAA